MLSYLKSKLSFKRSGGCAKPQTQVLPAPSEIIGHATSSERSVAMFVFNEIKNDSRVLKTAEGLTEAGYDVTLFGVWRDRTANFACTSFGGSTAYIFPNPLRFLRGVNVQALKYEHKVAYLAANMWPYVERIRPRFIHTHDYHTVLLGLEYVRLLRKSGQRVDWLHDIHDYVRGYEHLDPDWQRAILEHEERTIRHMDHRFTVSPLIAEWATQQYQLKEPPTIVLNAPSDPSSASPAKSTIRADLGLKSGVPLIVHAGHLFEARGVHTVVQALATDPTWHLALLTAATGAYVDHLKKLAEDGDCSDRLHFLPYVEPHQVASYLRDASIGIIPLKRYGNADAALPNKLYEYLHGGLPVVTSDCTLMKELVERWRVGTVFTAEDVHGCASAIRETLQKIEIYKEGIASNRERLHDCTWEEQFKKVLRVYSELDRQDRAVENQRSSA